MAVLNKLAIAACFTLQGVITLGVMIVVPIAWFFFGWNGPTVRLLGNSFVWSVVDVLIWGLCAMGAMFATSALAMAMEKLGKASDKKPSNQ